MWTRISCAKIVDYFNIIEAKYGVRSYSSPFVVVINHPDLHRFTSSHVADPCSAVVGHCVQLKRSEGQMDN